MKQSHSTKAVEALQTCCPMVTLRPVGWGENRAKCASAGRRAG